MIVFVALGIAVNFLMQPITIQIDNSGEEEVTIKNPETGEVWNSIEVFRNRRQLNGNN